MLAACPLHVWHPRDRGLSGGGPATSPRAQVAVTPVVQLGPLRPGKGVKLTAAVVMAAPGCPGAKLCRNRAGCSGRQPGPGQRAPWTPGLTSCSGNRAVWRGPPRLLARRGHDTTVPWEGQAGSCSLMMWGPCSQNFRHACSPS